MAGGYGISMRPPAPPLFTCSQEQDYVLLKYHSTFPGGDLGAHATALSAIDEQLAASRTRRALVDTRAMVDSTEQARDFCWRWVMARAHHDRVAIVANSELIRVQSNMTARARKMPLRSFATIDEAVAWLRRG